MGAGMPRDMLNRVLGSLLFWGLLAGLASVLATALRVLVWPRLKGWLGEASINFWARRMLDQKVYHLIPDVMLPTPDGTTQIDHVIVSRYGVFVIETKTYKGWIYGGEHDAQWMQVNFRRKDRFQNPLRQNYKHTKTLSDLTGIPHEYLKSLVVFVGESKFKTAMPANVVHVRDFIRHIKSHQTPVIKDEQVPQIAAVIRDWAGTVTDRQRAGHVAHVRQNKSPVSVDGQAPVCPRCGATMTLRTSRKDAGRFWGCTRYPECRGTRQVA
jgi:restriction system protein